MAEFLFVASFLLITYVYFGYPLSAYLLSCLLHRRPVNRLQELSVTIIISAYNEEKEIADTLRNKLSLDYPREHMEIIVVSDGSEDSTDIIVREFEQDGVRFIRQEPRQGKTAALNRAVTEAKGEIIIFSDANSCWQNKAISMLLRNFTDSKVGYVTGKMVYTKPGGSLIGDGCSAYMKYENLLREWESCFGSVIGVDGGIDAVRKKLYRPMKPDQLPDFVLPLMVIAQGYSVKYEPQAILNEQVLVNQDTEFRMRVRVSLRALWAIHDMRQLLNPFRYPVISWQLLSHKLLRYLAWIPIVVCLIMNPFILGNNWIYTLFILLQIHFYLLALIGYVMRNSKGISSFVFVPYYFVLINTAAAVALVRYLRGEKQVVWKPRSG